MTNQTSFDVYAASFDKTDMSVQPIDPELLQSGNVILKWDKPEKGTTLVPLTDPERLESLRENSNFTPRYIDLWLTQKGKEDPRPKAIGVKSENNAHSAITAWSDASAKTFYSLTKEYLIFRNPHLSDDSGYIIGYLFPEYSGSIIRAGVQIVPRKAVNPWGLTPIFRDEVTGEYRLGRELVTGWEWYNEVKASEGVTPQKIKAAQDWCQHANNAIYKYYLLRDMLVFDRRLRVTVWDKSWKYLATVLRNLSTVSTPDQARQIVYNAVEGKKEGQRLYERRTSDPSLKNEEPGKIARYGTVDGYWTEKELQKIPIGSRVVVMLNRNTPSRVFSGQWTGDMITNKQNVLSIFAGDGAQYALYVII